MKKITLIVMFLVLLVISIVIRDQANNAQSDSGSAGKETYVSQVIIDAPWGKDPGQFGIYEPDEGPNHGPFTFTISSQAEIFIYDSVNHRIQKFDSNGRFISVIPLTATGIEICVDPSGNVYLYHTSRVPQLIIQYDSKGNLLKEYPNLWDDEGMRVFGGAHIYCDKSGKLFLSYHSDSLKTYVFFQVGTTEINFLPEQQKATFRKGFVGTNTVVFDQEKNLQLRGNRFHLVDKSEKSIREYKPLVGGFVGVDSLLNIYTYRYDEKKDVEEMRKYSHEGDLVAEFNVQTDDFVWTSRSHIVDEHGNIYVMSTSKEGLKIIKWSPVEGGK
jgi:hypothetical protein